MIIDYISDLHLDFWYKLGLRKFNFEKLLPEKRGEILVIAGI
jgi:hypothetical protein